MHILTKEVRDSLTPESAIKLLKEGNKRFINNSQFSRDLLKQASETANGQNPFAIILSCIDSRASAELIFDQGIGDIFSCRIAGNIINEDVIGSMEFACKAAGVKLIMVLGHSACGAVKGACDDVQMGQLTKLLEKIKPAINSETSTNDNRNSSNSEFVENVAQLNVKQVLKDIPENSDVIKEMSNNGEIAIIGGMYDIANGVVDFYE